MIRFLSALLVFLGLMASVPLGLAQVEKEPTIPSALNAWIPWVLEREAHVNCPLLLNERQCVWTGSVAFEMREKGGTFVQQVSLAEDGKVEIPGGGEIFPIEVKTFDRGVEKPALMLIEEGHPKILLSAGKHQISGKFSWEMMPQSLQLPSDVGVVTLSLAGNVIERPRVNDNRELWLHDSDADTIEAEEDSLRVAVARKLSDGVPFLLSTQLELRVGGRAREIDFGKIIPSEFTIVSTSGELIHGFGREGNLKVQVRPGVHILKIEAVRAEPPQELKSPESPLKEWPADEVWAWEPNESLRSVTVSGAPGVDPQRTTLPEEWKRFPAYAITHSQGIVLAEIRRGEQELPPNQLHLSRRLWLDLDGSGLTVEDNLSGKMSQNWRLNMNSPTTLSRVEVSGQAQLITQDPAETSGAKSGIELRSSDLTVRAISRIEQSASSFPAVGWDHDVSSLSAELILPPGWQVLEIFGVDSSPGTWLSSWSLWDLFFLVLVSIAVIRIQSFLLGVVTFVGMGLAHQVPGAPHYVWLNIIAASALYRALPEGQAKRISQWYLAASCSFIALLLLSFSYDQVRSGLFPQLGSHPFITGSRLFHFAGNALAVLAVIAAGVMGIGAVVYLFTRQFKKFFRSLLLMGVCFIACGVFFALSGIGRSQQTYYADFSAQSTSSDMPAASRLYEQQAPMESEETSSGSFAKGKGYGGRMMKNSVERQQLLQIDKKAIVQTGVGVPSWQWKKWTLGWNGPVERNRSVELILLSPSVNLFLSLLRVAFFLFMLFAFSKDAIREWPRGLRWKSSENRLLSVFLSGVLAMGLFPSLVRAQTPENSFPPEYLLKELESRVKQNRCLENCLAANLLELNVQDVSQGVKLEITASLSSNGDGAWSIPGPLSEFFVRKVLVDGQTTEELRRDNNGLLWVRVPHGVHKVSVEGQLQRRNSATLQFGIVPQHVVLKAEGWTVDGLSKTGSVGESLQIIRAGQETEKKEDALETQAEIPLPDWYVVTREITLGQPWVVSTTVRRLGAGERSQMMKLPLLAGESVTEESIKVESGNAQVVFPRGESIVTWNSTFREEPKFELKASSGNNLNEEWKLRCATIWRCSFEGLKPVHTMEGSEYVIDWKPWPGEKVDILVSKPLGVDGLTETIREAKLHWEPGSGLLRGTLSFTILSSQGGFRRITLPPGAMVQQVMNGGSATNLMPKGQILELPIHPGEEQFSISWQQPWDAGFASQLPLVDIGGEAFNVNVSSTIPGKRWLLAAKGPAWGPAVLFWGGLTIVLCFGLLVGKLGVPPLKTREWIFLGLGTATLHPTVLLVPVFWSLLVELRRRKPLQNAFWFNGAQGGLLLLSLFTLGVLFASLYCGLIIDPDMGVRGQGSSTRFLKWYVDRSASGLPTPTIYWSPMWIYRLFMLCWSTWLVFVVLRWLKWAWSSLGDGGWWKRGDTKE